MVLRPWCLLSRAVSVEEKDSNQQPPSQTFIFKLLSKYLVNSARNKQIGRCRYVLCLLSNSPLNGLGVQHLTLIAAELLVN